MLSLLLTRISLHFSVSVERQSEMFHSGNGIEVEFDENRA